MAAQNKKSTVIVRNQTKASGDEGISPNNSSLRGRKQSVALIPQLRFAELEGDWELNILGQIASFSKGKNISKADIVEDGDIECIRYGELYTEYEEVIKILNPKQIYQ